MLMQPIIYGTTRKQRAAIARKLRTIQRDAQIIINEADKIIYKDLMPTGEDEETFE